MDSKDTTAAIEAASEAFKTWQHTTAKERSNLLRGWYNLCVQHTEDLAALLTAEQGAAILVITTVGKNCLQESL